MLLVVTWPHHTATIVCMPADACRHDDCRRQHLEQDVCLECKKECGMSVSLSCPQLVAHHWSAYDAHGVVCALAFKL